MLTKISARTFQLGIAAIEIIETSWTPAVASQVLSPQWLTGDVRTHISWLLKNEIEAEPQRPIGKTPTILLANGMELTRNAGNFRKLPSPPCAVTPLNVAASLVLTFKRYLGMF
jgi:hypothetical protein